VEQTLTPHAAATVRDRAGTGRPDTRLLGTVGMIGSPLLLVDGLCRYAGYTTHETQGSPLVGILGVAYLAGILCNAVGMRRLRVTGSGAGSAVLFAVQVTGLLLALVFSVAEALGHSPGGPGLGGKLLFAADMGWPFSHVLHLVIGGAIWKAGIWRGWRRIAPFVVGVALPLFFAARAVAGPASMLLFPLMTTAGFLALGYAVRTGGGYGDRPSGRG